MSIDLNAGKMIKFRLVDLMGFDVQLEMKENSTLRQLTTLLRTSYNIDTQRCEFSSNGQLLEDTTQITEDVLKPNRLITMFNNSLYQEKSFPRVDNAFTGISIKFAEYQSQAPQKQNKNIRSLIQALGIQLGNPLLSANIENLEALEEFINHHRPMNIGEGDISFTVDDNSYDDYDHDDYSNFEPDPDEENENMIDNDNDNENDEGMMPQEVVYYPRQNNVNAPFDINFQIGNRRFIAGPRALEAIYDQNDMNMFEPPQNELNNNLTRQQQEVVNRICMQTGADPFTVAQVYAACDYNEDMTTNCLMSMAP